MEPIVADIDDKVIFDLEQSIENQVGARPLPFGKMDKSTAAICTFYGRGTCKLDQFCPYRHVRAEKNVVCKHWLRGLCKKGDDCEFMHIYDVSRMPECYFYTMQKSCTNSECLFLHVSPESHIKECPWYRRGFCKKGFKCRLKHIRRILCPKYINGFCPEGLDCQMSHGKFYVDVGAFKNLLKSTLNVSKVTCKPF